MNRLLDITLVHGVQKMTGFGCLLFFSPHERSNKKPPSIVLLYSNAVDLTLKNCSHTIYFHKYRKY